MKKASKGLQRAAGALPARVDEPCVRPGADVLQDEGLIAGGHVDVCQVGLAHVQPVRCVLTSGQLENVSDKCSHTQAENMDPCTERACSQHNIHEHMGTSTSFLSHLPSNDFITLYLCLSRLHKVCRLKKSVTNTIMVSEFSLFYLTLILDFLVLVLFSGFFICPSQAGQVRVCSYPQLSLFK